MSETPKNRSANQPRAIVAFEYDCPACRKPLLEPEWDTPFYLKAEDGGIAPDLADYEIDGTRRIDDMTVHDTYDHCWHWCHEGNDQALGAPADCPDIATHEEDT